MSLIIPLCKPKIIVALDYSSKELAMKLVKNLDPLICSLKIGKEMFVLFGEKWIKKLQKIGFDIFLDLKFHDIPHTVFSAVKAAAKKGVRMISVHACGGKRMLSAAKSAIHKFKGKKPLLFAITMLTSMSEKDLKKIGINMSLSNYVLRLAKIAKQAGFDGVVCPGKEAKRIKLYLGNSFKVICPGVRMIENKSYDQVQVITPEEAKFYKIDYLVIGRSITLSNKPSYVLKKIINLLSR